MRKSIFVCLILLILVSFNFQLEAYGEINSGVIIINDSTPPNINIISPVNNSNIITDYTWLNITTSENSNCRYSLWNCNVDSCSKSSYVDMSMNPPVKTGVINSESFKIASSGNDLNMLEPLNNVKDVLDSGSLQALASGSITNDKSTYGYDQYLTLGNSTVMFAVSNENGVIKDPAIYFVAKEEADTNTINDGTELLVYKLSFPIALKSDIDSNRNLDDLDNKKITILGTEYTIINTDFSTVGVMTLDLMAEFVQDTMEEGETKTYTINGKDYETTVQTITDTNPYKVKFLINTETTDALQTGETHTISDNISVSVKAILPNEAGDITADSVEFYLGTQKLKLADSNSSSYNADGILTIGSNDISMGAADLVWSNTTTELSLSAIQIAWQLNNSYYIPNGGKLTDHLNFP